MKNSFFSRFTPKEPKFFPLLKQLSEVLCEASVVLIESLQHDSPTERSDYYKKNQRPGTGRRQTDTPDFR